MNSRDDGTVREPMRLYTMPKRAYEPGDHKYNRDAAVEGWSVARVLSKVLSNLDRSKAKPGEEGQR